MSRFGDSIVSSNPNQEFSSMSLNSMQDVVSAVQHILSMLGMSSGNNPHGNIREQINYLLAEAQSARSRSSSSSIPRHLSAQTSDMKDQIARLNRRIQLLEAQPRAVPAVNTPRILATSTTSTTDMAHVYEHAKGCVELGWTDTDGSLYTGSGWLYRYEDNVLREPIVYIVTAAHCGMIHTVPHATYDFATNYDLPSYSSRYSQTMVATIHVGDVKKSFPIAVVGADARADIMIAAPYISVHFNLVTMAAWQAQYANQVQPLQFGRSRDVRPGTTCYTIGNPNDFDSFSISRGIVRDNKLVHYYGIETFFADVEASPGNSGGPIIDETGKVCGLLTFSYASEAMVGGIAQYMMEPLVKKMAYHAKFQFDFQELSFTGPYENEKASLGLYIEVVKTSTLATVMHTIAQGSPQDLSVVNLMNMIVEGETPTGVLVSSTVSTDFSTGDLIRSIEYRPNDSFDPHHESTLQVPKLLQTMDRWGNVYSVLLDGESLVLGTKGSVTVFKYDGSEFVPDQSFSVQGTAHVLASSDTTLYIGTDTAVVEYNSNGTSKTYPVAEPVRSMSILNDNIMVVACDDGTYLLQRSSGDHFQVTTSLTVSLAWSNYLLIADAAQVALFNFNSTVTTQEIRTIVVTVRNGEYYLDGSNQPRTLQPGTYLFQNIPTSHPMAIVGIFDESQLTYSGDGASSVQSFSNGVRYFTGNMLVQVKGFFVRASLLCRIHGYMGGQHRLLYDLEQPAVGLQLPGIRAMVGSPDGTMVAAGGDDNIVYAMDDQGNTENLYTHSEGIMNLAFSPNSRYLAIAGNTTIAVYDLSIMRVIPKWGITVENTVHSVAFASNRAMVVGGVGGAKLYTFENDPVKIYIGNYAECLSNALWFINEDNASSVQIEKSSVTGEMVTQSYTYEALPIDKDVYLTDILHANTQMKRERRSWM